MTTQLKMPHLSMKGVRGKFIYLLQSHTAPAGGPDRQDGRHSHTGAQSCLAEITGGVQGDHTSTCVNGGAICSPVRQLVIFSAYKIA